MPGGCPLLNTAIDSDDGNPVLRGKARAALDQWRASIADIVRQGQQNGELRGDIDPAAVATIVIASLEGAVMMSRMEKTREPLHTVGRAPCGIPANLKAEHSRLSSRTCSLRVLPCHPRTWPSALSLPAKSIAIPGCVCAKMPLSAAMEHTASIAWSISRIARSFLPIDGDHIWLVEQFRYTIGERALELPQGGWEADNMDPEALARGELREETGLTAGRMTELPWMWIAYGFTRQRQHVFVAEELVPGPLRARCGRV